MPNVICAPHGLIINDEVFTSDDPILFTLDTLITPETDKTARCTLQTRKNRDGKCYILSRTETKVKDHFRQYYYHIDLVEDLDSLLAVYKEAYLNAKRNSTKSDDTFVTTYRNAEDHLTMSDALPSKEDLFDNLFWKAVYSKERVIIDIYVGHPNSQIDKRWFAYINPHVIAEKYFKTQE